MASSNPPTKAKSGARFALSGFIFLRRSPLYNKNAPNSKEEKDPKGLKDPPTKKSAIRYAPKNAPILPFIASCKNNRLLILEKRMWANPDTPVVNISAVCTLAEANFGGIPNHSKRLVQLAP